MDPERKRRAKHLPANMVSLPGPDLESGGRTVLPRPAEAIRRGAHLWFVRSARPSGGALLPQARSSLRRRADRDVCADCTQHCVKARLSRFMGQKNAGGSGGGGGDGGTRGGGAGL